MAGSFPKLGQRIASGVSDIFQAANNKSHVIKVIEADDDLGLGGALVDAVIGRHLQHPNLMHVDEVYFEDLEDTELSRRKEEEGEEGELEGEEFRWKIGLKMPQAQPLDLKLPWPAFRNLLLELVCAVESMHKAQLWHLDIKPDNVMQRGDRLLLIDFDSVAPEASNWKQGNPAVVGTEGFYPKPSLLASRRDIDALLLTLMNLVADWSLGQRHAVTGNKDASTLLIRQFLYKDTDVPFLEYKGEKNPRLPIAKRVYRALSTLVQGRETPTFEDIRSVLLASPKSSKTSARAKRVPSCPEAKKSALLQRYLDEFNKSADRDFSDYYTLLGTVFSENKDPSIAQLSRTLLEQVELEKRKRNGNTPSPRKAERRRPAYNVDIDDIGNNDEESEVGEEGEVGEEEEAARILASLYK